VNAVHCCLPVLEECRFLLNSSFCYAGARSHSRTAISLTLSHTQLLLTLSHSVLFLTLSFCRTLSVTLSFSHTQRLRCQRALTHPLPHSFTRSSCVLERVQRDNHYSYQVTGLSSFCQKHLHLIYRPTLTLPSYTFYSTIHLPCDIRPFSAQATPHPNSHPKKNKKNGDPRDLGW
jgi:hypothetical protein